MSDPVYTLRGPQVLKDGHTMFREDVVNDLKALQFKVSRQAKRIAELEAQVEAMKCCGNCENQDKCWQANSTMPRCRVNTKNEADADHWKARKG